MLSTVHAHLNIYLSLAYFFYFLLLPELTSSIRFTKFDTHLHALFLPRRLNTNIKPTMYPWHVLHNMLADPRCIFRGRFAGVVRWVLEDLIRTVGACKCGSVGGFLEDYNFCRTETISRSNLSFYF